MRYYLKIETRLTKEPDENNEYITHLGTIKKSKLFDNRDDCVKFANKLIVENDWMRIYKHDKNELFDNKWNRDLIIFDYKYDHAVFLLSIKEQDELDYDECDAVLKKYKDLDSSKWKG